MAARIKDNVKTMVGVQDDLQDAVIDIIIKNIESRVKIWLKQHASLDSIPEDLNFIIEEMAINRFNRIGSEGMTSEAVEGHSVSFSEDDLTPYLSILKTYIPTTETSGKVMFF
ncbi:phage head-tail connector protein [Thalassobacillus sp. CUG 92003]|uniref:phage head-tail connector protein n=1 Tax=Thalassobacillus sp. CUG 92003 TaxID=2736641 RepID=UPI0015E759A9|nr:phage head-tail connector protein [Thalassobacillus sp. CUG 92003]